MNILVVNTGFFLYNRENKRLNKTNKESVFYYEEVIVMTALRREAIQLVEQMPEEQMSHIVQYIRSLIGKSSNTEQISKNVEVTPKMKAFWELEQMLVPLSQELDYKKELAEARDEKYGYLN